MECSTTQFYSGLLVCQTSILPPKLDPPPPRPVTLLLLYLNMIGERKEVTIVSLSIEKSTHGLIILEFWVFGGGDLKNDWLKLYDV